MSFLFRIERQTISIIIFIFCLVVSFVTTSAQKKSQTLHKEPIRQTFEYDGAEREYFVWLPKDFEQAKTYWALVVVHGGGGNGITFWMTRPVRRIADYIGLEAIVISPTFDKNDPVAQRYPAGSEGHFLEEVLDHIRKTYHLHPRILLTGYSRGAQFSHRYALWYPNQVEACAPLAAGAWTTPDGRFFDDDLGEVKELKQFLTSNQYVDEIPASLKDPRVAEFGERKAGPGAKRIPFLVMCGSLDKRFEIAQEFAKILRQTGYKVETEWPRTHHGGREEDEYRNEFKKYPREVVEFFRRVTKAK